MRHVPAGNGTIREVTDLIRCSGCGHPFEQARFTLFWSDCSCTPGSRGHQITVCMRGHCRAETSDPPCSGERHLPIEDTPPARKEYRRPTSTSMWPAPPRWPAWYAGVWTDGALPMPPGVVLVTGAAWRKNPPRSPNGATG